MTDVPAPLTSGEEVTLRRIALGLTPLRLLPPQHVSRLERLNLIKGGGSAYQLTTLGWQRYHELPRPRPTADAAPAATIEQMLLSVVRYLESRNNRRRP
jgi:hypothetical protein